MMNRLLKILFFGLFIKPLVLIGLGLNLRGREKLPSKGPAIIVANHNSHLDTMVLMSLYPLSQIHKLRPVAAADYFVESGGIKSWLATRCIGIIAMDRSGKTPKENLFDECHQALDNGDTLILFPEGSRGQPENLSELKKGVYFLAKDRKHTPVIPVMMHGLGKALPKGEALFVPFNCDVIIGDALDKSGRADQFVANIKSAFAELSQYFLTR